MRPARTKILALGGAVLVMALLFFVIAGGDSPEPASEKQAGPTRGFDVGIPTMQKVEAFVQGYGSRVEATEGELARIRRELEETRKRLEDSLTEVAKARREDVGLLESVMQDVKAGTAGGRPGPSPAARVRKFDFALTPDQAKPSGRRTLHIPAGSIGEVTLLTGIFAPVTGDALPIHAKLDTALVGPNRTRIPVDGAFLVGKAQGDPNGARAVVQFHKLALVRSDGEAIELAINADVADGDGVLGLAGRYVWRAEEILTLAGLAGAASGAAEALSARDVSGSLSFLGQGTPVLAVDALDVAKTRGGAKGLERISEIVARRLEEITPAVYVANGKKATILFIDGVTVERFGIDEVDRRHADRFPYSGLDFDR